MTSRTLGLLVVLTALLSPTTAARAAEPGWRWPVHGSVLTAYRNGPDPYAGGQHRGIDLAAPAGTPVAAAAAGTVRFAGVAGDSGLTISIRTADGRFDTSYLHLGSIGVRAGSAVRAGERIGAVGTSGRRSVPEPHLHFGVRDAGARFAYRDPLTLLPPPGSPEPGARARPRTVPLLAERLEPAVGPGYPGGPASAPSGGPASAPSGRPASHPPRLPLPGSLLAPARTAAHAPGRVTLGTLGAGPGRVPGRGPSESAGPIHTAPITQHPARASSGGLDLGWLAACVGLVAAAMLLGRPRGPFAALRHARSFAPPGGAPLREQA
jgi:hypothetical protein